MFLIPIGLCFIFYSVPVPVAGGIDALPDFVGYLLISFNLWKLRGDSPLPKRAVVLGLGMAVFSAVLRALSPAGLAGFVCSALELAGQLIFLYLLVGTVREVEERLGRHLNHLVLYRWYQIVSIFWAGSYICVLGNLFIPGVEAFGAVVGLGSLVVCALFIITFFRTALRYRKILRADSGEAPENTLANPGRSPTFIGKKQ